MLEDFKKLHDVALTSSKSSSIGVLSCFLLALHTWILVGKCVPYVNEELADEAYNKKISLSLLQVDSV